MKIKLSDSTAVIAQGLLLLFFVPFNIFVWYLSLRSSVAMADIIFGLCLSLPSILIVFLSFKIADVTIENKVFCARSIFSMKRIPLNDFKKVSPLAIFGYRLEFLEQKNVYVLFNATEILSEAFSSTSKSIIQQISNLIESASQQ